LLTLLHAKPIDFTQNSNAILQKNIPMKNFAKTFFCQFVTFVNLNLINQRKLINFLKYNFESGLI